jgi:predicted metal-binding membrane protein
MALLFVLGVMNLVWIAVLSLFVLIEKIVPNGLWVGRVSGIALIVWGALLLVNI